MKVSYKIPKAEARKIILQRRKEITQREIDDKTDKILERFVQTDDFVYSKKIFAYVSPAYGEVDTKKIISFAEGRRKSIFLPKFYKTTKSFRRFHFTDWDDLILNDEGFMEPKFAMDDEFTDIDLILVPCLAVSLLGQRVGYGGGYYDKLLKKTYAPKYVLAFEFQLFNEIESDIHDVRIDRIITERRIIDTRRTFD